MAALARSAADVAIFSSLVGSETTNVVILDKFCNFAAGLMLCNPTVNAYDSF